MLLSQSVNAAMPPKPEDAFYSRFYEHAWGSKEWKCIGCSHISHSYEGAKYHTKNEHKIVKPVAGLSDTATRLQQRADNATDDFDMEIDVPAGAVLPDDSETAGGTTAGGAPPSPQYETAHDDAMSEDHADAIGAPAAALPAAPAQPRGRMLSWQQAMMIWMMVMMARAH